MLSVISLLMDKGTFAFTNDVREDLVNFVGYYINGYVDDDVVKDNRSILIWISKFLNLGDGAYESIVHFFGVSLIIQDV